MQSQNNSLEGQIQHLVIGSSGPKVFTIPEILLSVASFLSKNDLTTCLRVCQQWKETLLAPVWSQTEVTLGLTSPVPELPVSTGAPPPLPPLILPSPPLSVLRKHASLIQKLVLTILDQPFDFPGKQQPVLCANLFELEILAPLDRHYRIETESEVSLVEFLHQHSSGLRSVSYEALASKTIMKSLAGCTRLERLSIRYNPNAISVLEEFLSWYESQWSKGLKSLSWTGTCDDLFEEGGEDEESVQEITPELTAEIQERLSGLDTTRLQELSLSTLHYNTWPLIQAHLVLIGKSPDLVRLRWSFQPKRPREQTPMAILAAALTESTTTSDDPKICQRLESIHFLKMRFKNKDFKTVVESLPVLTELTFEDTTFNGGSWEILKDIPRYRTTLRTLRLRECPVIEGPQIVDILGSITSLEIFEAFSLRDTDVLGQHQRPWVCLGLKELTLGLYTLDFRSVTAERRFLNQISRLEQLDVLDLSPRILPPARTAERSNHSLKLTLDTGLDQLETLKRLRVLKGPYKDKAGRYGSKKYGWYPWSATEACWVQEHWPRLETLQGFTLDRSAEPYLTRKY
ncbi:hypothetical protein BGZ83_001590, partial [Gryganskiella cystojenkinii]